MKIFSDGADIQSMKEIDDYVDGFTTNPTLMKKAGITDYLAFAKEITSVFSKPISLEVFSDDFYEMQIQANKLSKISKNVYVKIPVSNSRGEDSYALIKSLSSNRIKLNITAVFTEQQIKYVYESLNPHVPSIISIFAGRIADTMVDPEDIIRVAVRDKIPNCEVLWASTREVFNILQARRCYCDIITVSPELLKKYNRFHLYCLESYSLDTVRMFNRDAQEAGYVL